jgi:bacillithiol synthase
MNCQSLQDGVKELRLGNLPGFPRLFIDYAECVQTALQFFSCHPDIQSLTQHAKLPRRRVFFSECILQHLQPATCSKSSLVNFRRLQDPETRIIWVTQPSSLLGGPFGQVLKCLTAVKLAEELEQRGVPTIPVCEINHRVHTARNQFSISVLDSAGKLQELRLRDSEAVAHETDDDFLIPPQIEEFFAILGSMTSNLPGFAILEPLKKLYQPGTPLSAASEGFTAKLFEDQGLVVLNWHQVMWRDFLQREFDRLEVAPAQIVNAIRRSGEDLARAGYEIQDDRFSGMVRNNPLTLPFLRQSILPVAAIVAEPAEMEVMGLLRPIHDVLGLIPPAVWPQASASLINGKTQKTLEKYRINLMDALGGKTAALGKIGFDFGEDETIRQFRSLAARINERMNALMILAEADDDFRASVEASRQKMLYQINKLRDRLDSSSQVRRAACERRLDRLVDNLAPNGMLQEQGLSTAHFLFHYSPELIHNLKERLDISRHTHQLIFMD